MKNDQQGFIEKPYSEEEQLMANNLADAIHLMDYESQVDDETFATILYDMDMLDVDLNDAHEIVKCINSRLDEIKSEQDVVISIQGLSFVTLRANEDEFISELERLVDNYANRPYRFHYNIEEV